MKGEWITKDGKVIAFDDLTHQHVCNIIKYYEGIDKEKVLIAKKILAERFGGILFPSSKGRKMERNKYYNKKVYQSHDLLTMDDFSRLCREDKINDEQYVYPSNGDYYREDKYKPSLRIMLPDDCTHVILMK